ncbi:heavy-metal-associated domain-containing protein [Ruania halotolerans]|uniref:heavy-metal-associated domain-containing protein n=1 Tax=Ruania halotolerans TaxID=2897773 RepID=UPI001E2BE019|nr:heavy metal-associated domain-containing protein [Ruania halotolerans]UFU06367.1 heavy-metal-associated domain-containing protein [Ruania halotolerans]
MDTLTTTIDVTGMTCGGCVAHVTEELQSLEGVKDVSVELDAGGTSTVTVISDAPLNEQSLRAAVAEAGYDVAAID